MNIEGTETKYIQVENIYIYIGPLNPVVHRD